MKFLNLIILVSFSIFFSCHHEQKEKEPQLAQLVNEWQGKEIEFPDNLIFTRYAKDTTDFQIPQSEYKVLVYVDSAGCTSCKLQLYKWKELIEYTDSMTHGKVPFLFFFHPKDQIEIQYLLRGYEFEIPVCVDQDDRLNSLNRFPVDTTFQTFLLDKNNEVLMSGNPIHDATIKDLFLKRLTGKDAPTKSLLKTTAKVTPTDIDFGSFKKSDIKEAIIEIKNIGNNPLVIVDVNITCGCTTAIYDKRPASPGESLRLEIKMTPKDTGFFDETVTVKCNTIEPIKIKIRGQTL